MINGAKNFLLFKREYANVYLQTIDEMMFHLMKHHIAPLIKIPDKMLFGQLYGQNMTPFTGLDKGISN